MSFVMSLLYKALNYCFPLKTKHSGDLFTTALIHKLSLSEIFKKFSYKIPVRAASSYLLRYDNFFGKKIF